MYINVSILQTENIRSYDRNGFFLKDDGRLYGDGMQGRVMLR